MIPFHLDMNLVLEFESSVVKVLGIPRLTFMSRDQKDWYHVNMVVNQLIAFNLGHLML